MTMEKTPLSKHFTFDIEGKTIAHNASISDAIEKMSSSGKNCLLVKKNMETAVGIISEHDIVVALARHGRSASGEKVSDYMTIDVVAVKESHTIDEALKLMAANNIRHLPILSEKGQILDFLSMMDLIVKKTSLGL